MLKKLVLSVLFCMSSAMAALPCMGDDGESGGSAIGDLVSTVGSGVTGAVSKAGSSVMDGAAIVGSGVAGIVGGVGDLVGGVSGAVSGDLVSMPGILGATGDLTSNLTDGLGNLLASTTGLTSIPSIGNLGNATDFPIVGPNIGYKRMLWLFSGESSITSIKALFGGVVNGIQDISGTIREGLNQFSKK